MGIRREPDGNPTGTAPRVALKREGLHWMRGQPRGALAAHLAALLHSQHLALGRLPSALTISPPCWSV